jgi:DNA polymerase phi
MKYEVRNQCLSLTAKMGSKRKRGSKEAGSMSQPLAKRPRQTEKAGQPSAEVLQEKIPFPLDPTNEDRKREATLYEFLGSEDPEERLAAAGVIIFGLLDGEGVPQTDLWRHIDRRLFRGLASGRKGSRIGFSLVLTELLSQLYGAKGLARIKYPDLSFEKLFKQLLENTTPKGNIPGQQEKDHYLGQLFGIESFISSGICASDNTKWQTILDVVFKLAQTKTWIRPHCGWLIVQSVPRMTKATAELTLQKLAEEKLVKTSEGIGILLAVTKRFPNVDLPPKTWRDPLATKNLGDLAFVVKESGRQSDDEAVSEPLKPRQANWTAQLHFIWDMFLQHFQAIAETDEKSAAEQLRVFWNRVVDGEICSILGLRGTALMIIQTASLLEMQQRLRSSPGS